MAWRHEIRLYTNTVNSPIVLLELTQLYALIHVYEIVVYTDRALPNFLHFRIHFVGDSNLS